MERLTLAQIATSSLAAARALERHGIDYCGGSERNLAEVCAAQAIDVKGILAECSVAADDTPDDRDWTTEPLADLMRFLTEDHVIIKAEIEALQLRLDRVSSVHADLYPGLAHLRKVFAGLCSDLHVHMGHEEADVFPAVQRYLDAIDKGIALKGSPLSAFGGPLRMMETEHEAAGAALRLMREFAQNYDVPQHACPMYQMLVRGMSALEDRVLRHMYLENNVLFSRAAALKPRRANCHV